MTNPVSPVSAEELLPCPFCGSDATLRDLAGWEIHCQCGVEMVLPQPDKEPLIVAWNRRTPAASGATPEGYALVPVEPTEEMHVAAVRTIIRCTGNADFPPRVWRAMIAAAPIPPDPTKEEA